MTAHKHADFFRAIADGSDMSQWECHKQDWSAGHWPQALSWAASIAKEPNTFMVRRKPAPVKTETRTYECWAHVDGYLHWCVKGRPLMWPDLWHRVPSLDKVCEVVL